MISSSSHFSPFLFDTYLPNERGSPFTRVLCSCTVASSPGGRGVRMASVRDSVTLTVLPLGSYLQAPSLAQAGSGGVANVVLAMPRVQQSLPLLESRTSGSMPSLL